ncbi:RICIN domain-containing protein [Kitasatospora sp. NPDC092039]|uniref:RICIN domain-containing protein n=1 Tax=Kitasatospora sp. NPDC092039 TaxID=3364086 RepID=UPI003819CC58
MSPAKRIATAAVTAALLAGSPGLATAATPQTGPPAQQTEQWHRFRIYPPPNLPARDLDVDSGGRAVVSAPEAGSERQQWSLSTTGGLPLIKNRATGTCLTAPNDTQDPVTVQACDTNNPNQRWDVHYVTSGQVEISPRNHLDLALTGSAQAGSSRVVLRPYAAQDDQQWFLRSVT